MKFIVFFCLMSQLNVWANALDSQLEIHESYAQQALLKNISPNDALAGTVIASPSRSNPDYYYHWVRDASLVMQVVLNMYELESDPIIKEQLFHKVKDFVSLTDKQQELSGFKGIGEPKYFVDGRPYDGPWGRPQNDGPALRASVLIRYANLVLQKGELVDTLLNKVIQLDLQYVLSEWTQPNFDLWEEVLGDHFYTRFVQRKALIDGELWARKNKLFNLSQRCQEERLKIEASLEDFKNSSENFLMVTVRRVGGLDYKFSQLDSANILAILHAYNEDGVFSPNNPWILNTVMALQNKFSEIYPINQVYSQLGTAFGRYPEDKYYGGNPWFLTTFAVAELYFLIANQLQEQGSLEIDSSNKAFYKSLIGNRLNLNEGKIRGSDLVLLQQKLIEKGDDLLKRGLFHSGRDGSMAEQMNLYTGFMESANDLTWSYASFITAMQARRKLLP